MRRDPAALRQLESEGAKVPMEINVISQTVGVASREVEKFVDRALAGLPRVRRSRQRHGHLRKPSARCCSSILVASVIGLRRDEGGGGATFGRTERLKPGLWKSVPAGTLGTYRIQAPNCTDC
jgi:hypothetical protein